MEIPKPLRIFVLTLLLGAALLLGWQLGMRYEQKKLRYEKSRLEQLFSGGATASGQVITDPEKDVDPALMWAVWRLMLKHYIEPDNMDTQEMLFGATKGLVEAVEDPYSVFMTPKQNKDFRSSLDGKLQGIGAELTMRDSQVIVVAPLKGSPASKAGLKPEDIILLVDGEEIEGETLNEVVQRIRGPKGTRVTLSIMRGVTKMDITITRDRITVPSTEYEVMETGSGSLGYISINQFGDSTAQEVQQALVSFGREEKLDGLIIDLRYNGGGYLDRAVDLASMFLRQGKVVSVARRDTEPEVHYVYGQPLDAVTDMAVIINEGSASASEILAGALQDHKRATVFGKTSFGKGTIQEIFELPGGSSLRVTVAKWLTPNGKDLGKEGVHPNIEIDRTIEDYENDIDPQLDAAIEWLLDGEDLSMEVAEAEVVEE